MTDQAERYDRIAEGYARWWAPVLAPSARALLDHFGSELDEGTPRLLDVGSGTGTLTLAALERWPDVRVDAIDASREMLAATERAAVVVGDGRFAGTTALADALPFEDDSFDAAMSSFVLQLVPNRARALREIRRVLRPGGRLAYVTWVWDDRSWRPDEILDDVLDDLEIGALDDEERVHGTSAGDLPSAESAAGGLRSAGFREVRAEAARLRYQFDPASYAAFVTEFDERDLVETLEPDLRRRFVAELTERLSRLDPTELVLETPIAYATGRKPRR